MFSWDSMLSGFSSVIDSIGGGISSITSSIGSALKDFDLSDITTTFSNKGQDFLGAGADFLFGTEAPRSIGSVGGIDDSAFDVGKTMSAAPERFATKGLIGGAIDFIEANPKATQLLAGAAAGAYGAYDKKKDREFLQQQMQVKNEQERNLLREKYDLDAKERRAKSDFAFNLKGK